MSQNNKDVIYFDNCATRSDGAFTVPDNYANPNSLHVEGMKAKSCLDSARLNIAEWMGPDNPNEIIFTSGATESNNMAIVGMAIENTKIKKLDLHSDGKNNPIILIGVMEHASVVNVAMSLTEFGFHVDSVLVDKNGFYDINDFKAKINDRVVLVSLQTANTEIGAIQNLEPFIHEAHKYNALFHSDCVGSFAHVNYDFIAAGVDAATVSGHKLGAPKGIGALYIKAHTPCRPLIFGGAQELGWRSGTQNVALIQSMSNTFDFVCENMEKHNEQCYKIKKYTLTEIDKLDGVRPTVSDQLNTDKYLTNILHLVFKNKDRKELVKYYSNNSICVSGGTACSMHSDKACRIMVALDIPKDEIFGSVRLSFSYKNTIDEAKQFIKVTKKILGVTA